MLQNKTALVYGVINKYSLAWHVASAWRAAGANVVFSVANDRFVQPVRALTADWTTEPGIVPCDVQDENQIKESIEEVKARSHSGTIDAVLHSIAYAPASALRRPMLELKTEDFKTTLEVSSYSLISIAKHASACMPPGGSITSLTFQGSQQVRARPLRSTELIANRFVRDMVSWVQPRHA